MGDKGAFISGIATSGTGLATWLDWLPDLMGMLATGFGIILTGMLMYKTLLEIKEKQNHRRETKERKAKGLPLDRKGDG